MVASVIGFASQLVVPRDMVPIGGIINWSGAIVAIPSNYALCDGDNATPDLRDRFVIGAGDSYPVAQVGGTADHVHGPGNTSDVPPVEGIDVWSGLYTDAQNHLPPYYALAYIMRIS